MKIALIKTVDSEKFVREINNKNATKDVRFTQTHVLVVDHKIVYIGIIFYNGGETKAK